MVNKSAEADWRATKMLFDMMKEGEQKAGTATPPEPAKLTPAHKEVVEQFMRDCAGRSRPGRRPPPIRPVDRTSRPHQCRWLR